MGALPYAIPTFDPQHPDVEILEAYEAIRAHRAHVYTFDYLADGDLPAFETKMEEFEAEDAKQLENEKGVYGTWATTPAGVAAQLMLTITADCERWIDRGLAEQGLYALYHARAGLDGTTQQIVQAAYELIMMEFEQAFDAYTKAASDFRMVLRLQAIVEAEEARLKRENLPQTLFLDQLSALVDEMEESASDAPAIRRLAHTLAPDRNDFMRKAKVIMAEPVDDDFGAWLARDTAFITGVIEPKNTEKAA